MTDISDALPETDLTPGSVHRLGKWAVGNTAGEDFAVSRRCRHQLADMSSGSIDANGCLVCPWHGSRYDVRTGRMVIGPRGFLAYHGKTPWYGRVVLAYGKILRLAVGKVVRRDGRVTVE